MTDWNTFNNKQSFIPLGTTAQYYRWDKTWATLDTSVVGENGSLYWTQARFDNAINLQKNVANGVAGLDANAKVSVANLPGITINSVWTATTKATCTLMASATRWDICIASSDSKSYVLSTTTPGNLADWQELLNPAAPVSQVNGQIGNINFVGINGISFSGTTASLTNVGIAGTYGSSTMIPIITTDAQGRVTSVTQSAIPIASATATGLLNPIDWNTFNNKQNSMVQSSTTASGWLSSTDWNTFNNKLSLTSLSATGGISYNNTTGLFSDLFTFTNGLTRTGNSIGISSVTGAQLSGFTSGQLIFGTATGGLTQSSNLFWDNASGSLGIGTSTPLSRVHIVWTSNSDSAILLQNGIGASGFMISNSFNESANKQMWLGDADYMWSATGYFSRYGIVSGNPYIDVVRGDNITYGNLTLITNGTNANTISGGSAGKLAIGASYAGASDQGSLLWVNGGISVGNSYRTNTAPTGGLLVEGNVGIGTSAPWAKLEIDNTTANTSGLRFTRLTSTGASSSLFSGLLGVNSTGDVGIAQLTGNSFTGFTAGQLAFGTASGGLIQSSGLFFDSANGRLGVGTSAPTTKLSLNLGGFSNTFANLAGSYIYGNATNAPGFYGYAISMDNTTNGNAYASFNITRNAGTAYLGAEINSVSRDGFRILNGNSTGSLAEVFRINNSGQVGIGTSAPWAKLEINSGTGGLSGLRFTNLTSTSIAGIAGTKVLSVNANGDVVLVNDATTVCTPGFTSGFGGNYCFGTNSLQNNTTGYRNASIGDKSLQNNTTGYENMAIGWGSLTSNTSGAANVAVGIAALESNISGNFNVANGWGAARANTTGLSNLAQGAYSLYANTTGSYNVALGDSAAKYLIVGSNNIAIGYSAQLVSSTGSNQLNIGNWIYGNNGNIGIWTTSPNYKLEVNGDINAIGTVRANGVALTSDSRLKSNVTNIVGGLDTIRSLRAVNFDWNPLAQSRGITDTSRQYGFIAQEVGSVIPDLETTSADGYKGLNYIGLIPLLTRAVQELDQSKASTGSLEALSGSLATLSGQIALLSQSSGSTVVNNNYYSSGTTSSGTSSSWVDTAFSFVSSLLVRVEATFSEMVTFMKSVVFRSTVTFEDRVTFSDTDMAGTVTIRAGESSVRIDFSRPYSEIPRVTVTADAFVTYRVTDKMVTGFTIETQSPVSTDTNFDWMALMVRGLVTTVPSAPSAPSTPPSGTDTSSASSNTGSTDTGIGTSDSNTGSTLSNEDPTDPTSTESGSITPPQTDTTPTEITSPTGSENTPPQVDTTTVSDEVTP
jgi:hypothetical protein